MVRTHLLNKGIRVEIGINGRIIDAGTRHHLFECFDTRDLAGEINGESPQVLKRSLEARLFAHLSERYLWHEARDRCSCQTSH